MRTNPITRNNEHTLLQKLRRALPNQIAPAHNRWLHGGAGGINPRSTVPPHRLAQRGVEILRPHRTARRTARGCPRREHRDLRPPGSAATVGDLEPQWPVVWPDSVEAQ